MEKPYVVGIDIGAQTAKYGIVDARGNVLAQSVIVSNSQPTAEEFINDLCNGIRKLAGNEYPLDQIRGIGVGAPNGNYYTGTIENAANLTWAKNGTVEFVKMMESQLGVPVALTNDANAAAVGEMTYGAARGMKNFIIITLGTGVGSGIVINGDVVYGHDGFAGELGPTCRVSNNGRSCGCGKTGCL